MNNIEESFHLEDWFATDVLEKLSEKQISFNPRVVEINGHLLCYYSHVPPYFHEKKELRLTKPPKQGVQIANILSIEHDDENTRTKGRPNVFKITFQKRHLIQFKNSQREVQVFRENYTRNYTPEDAEVILDSSRPFQQPPASKFSSNNIQPKIISKEPLAVWVFQCRSIKERDEWETRIRVLRDFYLAANIESELARNQQILRKQYEQQNKITRFKDTPGPYTRKPQLDQIDEEVREEKTGNSLENKNINSVESTELQQSSPNPNARAVTQPNQLEETELFREKRDQMRMFSMNGAFESMLSMSSAALNSGEHPDFQNKLKSRMFTADADLDQIKEDEQNQEEKIEQMNFVPSMTEEELLTAKLKKEQESEEQKQRNQQVCNSVYELRYTNFIEDQAWELKNGQPKLLSMERDSEIASQLIGANPEPSLSSTQSTLDFDEKFRMDLAPLELIGQFNNDAQEATKALIDDLLFFGSQKKYYSTQIESQYNLQRRSSVLNLENTPFVNTGTDPDLFEMLPEYEFRIQHKPLNDFVIKLSWIAKEQIEIEIKKDQDEWTRGKSERDKFSASAMDRSNNWSGRQREVDYMSFDAYTNFQGKALSAEFKALNLINTEHIKHKSSWNQWIKVPLSCIVTYKGFKALVQANPPDEDGLVHGPVFNSERVYEGYKILPQIEQQLQSLGKRLGIKQHTFKNGNSPKCQVFLCFVTEVHKGKRFQKIQQLIKDESAIQNSVAFSQETYYLKNVGDIFPVNENYLSKGGMLSKTVQFRQEYLASLRKELNPDAFEDDDPESQVDAEAIGQASLYLEEVCLKQFIRDLDGLKLNVIDSFTLRESMHKAGINMKYLGEITKQTQIPFLMNLGIADMIARAFKKILNSTISGLYLKSKQWVASVQDGSQTSRNNSDSRAIPNFSSPINRMQTFGPTKSTQPTEEGKQQSMKDPRVRQVDEITRDAIIDILNLLFCRDEESQLFHDILNKQVNYDFNYDRIIDFPSVKQGQLLAAVCFHCDLSLTYSADIFTNYEKKLSSITKLINDARSQRRFEDEPNLSALQIQIFSREHYVDNYATSHVFSMDTLGIMSFINNNNKIDCSYPLELRIAAIKQSLNVKKLTNTLTPTSHLFHLSEISRLYFEGSQYQNSAKAANDAIQLQTRKIEEETVIVPDCQLVSAMMVLLKISLKSNISDELRNQTTIATQNILKILKFLVDDNHPLFYELTSIFIQDKAGKKDVNFDTMKRVMESEIQGLIRALGQDHPRIAERYKGFADYQFEQDRTAPGALAYYEKAFSIFSQMESSDSTAYSKAECSYSMSLIFYYKNQMDQCRKYLGIALKEFEKKSEDIDRVSKLCLLMCYLTKQSGNIKSIILECEETWRVFDSNPFYQMKLIEYYKELVLIYIEIIAESWNRNMKMQFNQLSVKLKQLITENIQIPTSVRKCFLKVPLAISSIDQIFAKKNPPLVNRLIEDDSAAEAQLKLFQEKRLQILINAVTESGQEVWRFIERQFLILSPLSNSKIGALYNSRESLRIIGNQNQLGNSFSEDQVHESSLNFFETLIIVFGFAQIQKIFCEF